VRAKHTFTVATAVRSPVADISIENSTRLGELSSFSLLFVVISSELEVNLPGQHDLENNSGFQASFYLFRPPIHGVSLILNT
jgi:hypothetical protein